MKLNFYDIVSWKSHALGISNFSSFFCLRGIHFDMASEKTNSARYGSQAREIIKRVYNVRREKKKDEKLSLPLCSPLERTTHLCNVSASTVQRIQKVKTEEPNFNLMTSICACYVELSRQCMKNIKYCQH